MYEPSIGKEKLSGLYDATDLLRTADCKFGHFGVLKGR